MVTKLANKLVSLYRSLSLPSKDVVGRSQGPSNWYPDDVCIVSYPKSGNTWTRFLLGNYVTNGQCDFSNIHLVTPNIHENPHDCENLERPRFIKSHFSYTPDYPNVIYIVRDGRDVAVSYYYYLVGMKKIANDLSFGTFINKFNSGDLFPGVPWGDHVQGWLSRGQEVLVIRYEDLLQDAHSELRKMLVFAGLKIDPDLLKKAVRLSRFDKLKALETRQKQTADVFKDSDERFRLIREGQSGQWKMHFDKRLNQEFVDVHGDCLEEMGYQVLF